MDWRRLPSVDKISDKLFVGNAVSATDLSFLSANGVTHILSCGSEFQSGNFPKLPRLVLDIRDNVWNEKTEDEFLKGATQLALWLKRGETVYVHCYAGVSRSVTTVLLYLMHQGLSLRKAYDLVSSKRWQANPAAPYWRFLLRKEDERRGL